MTSLSDCVADVAMPRCHLYFSLQAQGVGSLQPACTHVDVSCCGIGAATCVMHRRHTGDTHPAYMIVVAGTRPTFVRAPAIA